jgi:hypothetical protein
MPDPEAATGDERGPERSREREIPVPEGVTEGGTAKYTEDELTTWVQAWEQQASLANGGRPTE